MDDLGKKGALAIAAVRIGLGVGVGAATAPALTALGFAKPSGDAITLARLTGGRDIALGVLTLSAAGSRPRLREAAAIGAAVDLGDALAFGAATANGDLPRATGVLNTAIALSAVVAGGWVVSRLS